MLAHRWRDTLTAHPKTRVVANVDDPLVVWAAGAAHEVTWVAGGAAWHSDAAACPECGSLLIRSATSWSCPGCGLARPEPTIEPRGNELRVAGTDYAYELALPGRANRGNLAIAVGARRRARRGSRAGTRGRGRRAPGLGPLRTPSTRQPRRDRAPRQESGRLGRDAQRDRRPPPRGPRHRCGRHQRARTRWSRPLVAVGRAVRAARGPQGDRDRASARPTSRSGSTTPGVEYRKDTRAPLLAAGAAEADPVVIAATYTNFLSISRELDRRG